MYWISDRKAALCIVRGAADVEHKFKLVAVPPEHFEKENPNDSMDLLDHVLIEDLAYHKNKVIIYDQSDLNHELDEIICIFNFSSSL